MKSFGRILGKINDKIEEYLYRYTYGPSVIAIILLLVLYRNQIASTASSTVLWLNLNYSEIVYNKFLIAFFLGYVAVGIIADFLLKEYALWIWERSGKSYLNSNFSIPDYAKAASRKYFSWAPRRVGIIERILYTSAIVFNQYALIGAWLVFKVIGEWKDEKTSRVLVDPSENLAMRNDEGWVGRVRANNFLIGTSLSLLFGIIGGILFRTVIDPKYLIRLIEQTYQ